jgi:hypothetical protein
MIVDVMRLATAFIIPVLAGCAVILFFFRRRSMPLFLGLALSWGVGWGILSHLMLLLGITGIPFSLKSIILPLYGLTCLLFVLYKKNRLPSKRSDSSIMLFPEKKEGDALFRVIWTAGMSFLGIFIAYYVYFFMWHTHHIPIIAWDAVATIAFKAKVFFYSRGLQDLPLLPLSTYPLHTPLSMTWVAICLGHWDEYLLKWIFPVYLFSFMIIFYYFLRLHVSKWWATVGVVLLLSLNFMRNFPLYASRDLALMYYNCLAVMLLLFWQKTRWREFVYLAGLFSGLATFTKLEALAYPFMHGLLFMLMLACTKENDIKEKARLFLSFAGIVFAVFMIYFAFKSGQPLEQTGRLALDIRGGNLSRLPVIFKYFHLNLCVFWFWGWIWGLLLMIFAGKRRLPKSLAARYLMLAVLMFFGMWIIIFVFTVNFNIFHKEVGQTVDLPRFFLHFFPLVPALAVLWMNDDHPPATISQQDD